MKPLRYVVMQHAVRLDRPVKAYGKWMARIPFTYREAVLSENTTNNPSVERDPHCLATLKHYRSLMPMAQEARKPMFFETCRGAIGAHGDCYHDFKALATQIAERSGIPLP
jgi:chromosome partitioning protein